VKATGWVSFFTDLGSEIVYPMLPQFVIGTLRAPKAWLGLMEGLAEGTPAIIRYFSGRLADRVKNRKWLIFAGYGISSVAKPFIGLAKFAALALAPLIVTLLRVVDKIGKGIRTAPRDALVADYAEKERGRAFGFQRAMDHAGAVAGGLAAFLLLGLLKLDIAVAIALSAVPGVFALLTILLFVREKAGRSPTTGERGATGAAAGGLSRTYYAYLVAVVLFAMANSSDAFLLVRAQEMGIQAVLLPLAWSLLHVVKTITSYAGGGLSDRVGRRPLLLAGWVLYGAVYTGFASASGAAAGWWLFGAYGVFFGLTEGVAKAFVADMVPEGARGAAYGLLGMMEGLLLIPSSLLAGWLWDLTGDGQVPLSLNALFALAAALWLALFVRAPARPGTERSA